MAGWNLIREELRCDTNLGMPKLMKVIRRCNKRRRYGSRVEENNLGNSDTWNKKWPSRFNMLPLGTAW